MAKKGSLTILLDSNSLDRVLPSLNRRSKALLKYDGVKFIKLLRSPERVKNKELQKIIEYHRKSKGNGSLHSIEVTRGEYTSKHAFGYRREVAERIGKLVFQKDELNIDEKKAIELVFIQATLNRWNGLNIMVTQNEVLLENRLWFESHFPGGLLNIMALEEATEVVDLLLKHNGEYPITDHYNVNKGYWYWLSFRTKVPFYHVGLGTAPFEKSNLDALAQRFVFLLMCVDEIGFQYYSGVNNDTMESMIYHFNYFISLASGIFDSLALQTFKQYELIFKGSNIPSHISLHKKTGRNFLRALGKRNLARARARKSLK